MPRETRHTPRSQADKAPAQPFETIEEAWFWFIQAQQARIDGARITAGAGLIPRPCEPLDILQALDHIYRARKVTMDHLLTLRHYGRMRLAPDPKRRNERKAYFLWCEVLSELSTVLIEKKILKAQGFLAPWLNSANILSIENFREAAK